MKRKFTYSGFTAVLLFLGVFAPPCGAETRILLTLEWPPYTSIGEPGGGSVTRLVNDVFHSMGDTTRVGYFSWHRVLKLLRSDRRFAASYPMYYAAEREKTCYFSDPIGEGPLGLAVPRAKPLPWLGPADLIGNTIGVVKGYVNSADFDQLVAGGMIHTLAAESDADNLSNLLQGRVQAAVVDVNVYHYLSQHNPALADMEKSIKLSEQLLETKKVYMCFPRDPAGLALRDSFNAHLRALHRPLPGSVQPPAAGGR